MKLLLKIEKSIDEFLKKVAAAGKENYVLWSIERSRTFSEMKDEIRKAFLIQTSQFLRTDVWAVIRDRIGKQEEPMWTEDDERQIRETTDEKFELLSSFIAPAVLIGFYVYFANRGGQAFLDKTGVRGTFDLRDAGMIEGLSRRTDLLINTVDNTTKKWLGNQIINGKKAKLSDMEIANKIRERIPETYKYRAEAIVRTEMTEIVNRSEFETAQRNEATLKRWAAAGGNICPVCEANNGEEIGMNAVFVSGHSRPPVHPYCKCLLEFTIPPFVGRVWTGE